MECPFCGSAQDEWRHLHRHLADAHADLVVRGEDLQSRLFFHVACPRCAWRFEQPLRGRRRDAAFLEEFAREITLVAFDQLMVHWVEDHEATPTSAAPVTGGDSGDSERL
jgi:hypothetical protein